MERMEEEHMPYAEEEKEEDVWIEEGYHVVATDGSSKFGQHGRLRRSGWGVYWGPNHPWNRAEPLPYLDATAQMGEIQSLRRVVAWAQRPTE
eukprot:9067053-Heterocapsa_arctica.AAC.1